MANGIHLHLLEALAAFWGDSGDVRCHADIRLSNVLFRSDACVLLDRDYACRVSEGRVYPPAWNHAIEDSHRHEDATAGRTICVAHDAWSVAAVCGRYTAVDPVAQRCWTDTIVAVGAARTASVVRACIAALEVHAGVAITAITQPRKCGEWAQGARRRSWSQFNLKPASLPGCVHRLFLYCPTVGGPPPPIALAHVAATDDDDATLPLLLYLLRDLYDNSIHPP